MPERHHDFNIRPPDRSSRSNNCLEAMSQITSADYTDTNQLARLDQGVGGQITCLVSRPGPLVISIRATPFTFAQRSPKPGVTRR